MDNLNQTEEISKREIMEKRLEDLHISLNEEKQVFDLKNNEEHRELRNADSLKATEKEYKNIADVLEENSSLLDGELRAELEIRQGRNMSHILINSRKFTGDSKEMTDIKDKLIDLERTLRERRENPLTAVSVAEIEHLEGKYMAAINSCRHYLNVKTTRTGSSRYAMVLNRMNNLCSECALISKTKLMADNEELSDYLKVECGSDLIMAAKLHDLVRETTVNESVSLTAQNEEVDNPEVHEHVPVSTSISEENLEGLDTPAKEIIKLLTMMNKPQDFVKKTGDDNSNITRAILNLLRDFPKGEHAVYINSGTFGYKGKEFLRKYDDNGKSKRANTLIGLSQNKDGRLFIKVGDFSQELPYTREVITDGITNNILDNDKLFGREAMDDAMSFIKYEVFGKYDPATVRNICLKYVNRRTGIEPTRLHNLTTLSVRMLARYLMEDSVDRSEIEDILTKKDADFLISKKMINGKETLELLKYRDKNVEKLNKKVIFIQQQQANAEHNAQLDPNEIGEDGWTQNEREVKAFLADIIFSKDTWIADESVNEPSLRLKSVFKEHSYAFILIARDESILDDVFGKMPLPKEILSGIKSQLGVIRFGVRQSGYSEEINRDMTREEAQSLAEEMLEDTGVTFGFKALDHAVIAGTELGARSMSDSISEKVDRLLASGNNEKVVIPDKFHTTDVKKLTDEEKKAFEDEGSALLQSLIDESMKGDAGQGLFMKNVLKNYFAGVPNIDKRAMIASAMRDARAERPLNELTNQEMDGAAGVYLGGIFKGAGPLMQKMLQGMPLDGMQEEFKQAFIDVKSKLLPIPKEIVESQFLSMIERSNNAVERIEITRALGAASVGQAFLCKIYGPTLPAEGKEVVVKLLRPDVRNRMMREKKVMKDCAKATNSGMLPTYEGQLARIEEELDLTIEARNVERGRVYDKSFDKTKEKDSVSSMKLNELIAPTTNSMVLEKSPGTTVDKYFDELQEKQLRILDNILLKDENNNPVFENGMPKLLPDLENIPGARHAKYEFRKLINQAKIRQKHLVILAQKWVEEGLFGSGFYHGDLHAGNIMIDDDSATVIDFGNATQLEPEQLGTITKMISASAIGEANAFVEGFHKLMKKDKATEKIFKENKEAFTNDVKLYFKMGSPGSTGQRIAAVLLKAQEIGLELPSAIFNFSQCQLRLQNTISDMNANIKRMEAMAAGIGVTADFNSISLTDNMNTIAANAVPQDYKLYDYYYNNLATVYSPGQQYFVNDMRKTDAASRAEFDDVFRPQENENSLSKAFLDLVENVMVKRMKRESVETFKVNTGIIPAVTEMVRALIQNLEFDIKKEEYDEKKAKGEKVKEMPLVAAIRISKEKSKEFATALVNLLNDEKTTRTQINELIMPYILKRNFPLALEELRTAQDSGTASEERLRELEKNVVLSQEEALGRKNVNTGFSDVSNAGLVNMTMNVSLLILDMGKLSNEKLREEMAPFLKEGEEALHDELTLVFNEVMAFREANGPDYPKTLQEEKLALEHKFLYYYQKRMRQECAAMMPEIRRMFELSITTPGDFITVMGKVIRNNIPQTVSRLGYWGVKHRSELMGIE